MFRLSGGWQPRENKPVKTHNTISKDCYFAYATIIDMGRILYNDKENPLPSNTKLLPWFPIPIQVKVKDIISFGRNNYNEIGHNIIIHCVTFKTYYLDKALCEKYLDY